MHHDVPLISTAAMAFVLACAFGFAAHWLRLPPLVGYLLAGIVIGPFTPGFVADAELAGQLAEIGVILLMFGVGLHFSIGGPAGGAADRDAGRRRPDRGGHRAGHRAGPGLGLEPRGAGWSSAWRCRSRARSCCCGRSRSATASMTPNGRIAVGWLIVEDLAMVLALVLLPALAGALGGGTDRAAGRRRRRQHLRRPLAITLRQGRGVRRPRCSSSGRSVVPVAARAGRPHRLARAVHALRCWRWRSASPSARRSCSASRSRSAPSSPAWC